MKNVSLHAIRSATKIIQMRRDIEHNPQNILSKCLDCFAAFGSSDIEGSGALCKGLQGCTALCRRNWKHGQRPSGLHRQAMKACEKGKQKGKKSPSSGRNLGGRHAPLFSCRGKMVTKGNGLQFRLLAASLVTTNYGTSLSVDCKFEPYKSQGKSHDLSMPLI